MVRFFLFSLLICLFFSQNAMALCEKNKIKIHIELDTGRVVYNHSLSKTEFQKVSPVPIPNNISGLTLLNLERSMRGKAHIRPEGNRYCIGVEEIEFHMGYEEIEVLIDKKYPVDSCPYRVIKEHENYHVAVAQEGLAFFKKDIEAALQKATQNIRPEYAYSAQRAEQIMSKQLQQILQRIEPLLNHIQKKANEKNAAIDTPDSYRKTTSLCPRNQW